MGARVGHGSGNNAGHVGVTKSKRLTLKQIAKEETAKTTRARTPLQVTLGDLIARKKL